MFEAEDIRQWQGRDVVGEEGSKIGSLESVYVDTGSDEPFFATVTVGVPTRHRLVFVPLTGATVGPEYVKVSYPKSKVKDAPSIGTGGQLPVERESEVFSYYDIGYERGRGGERRLARR